MKIKHINYKKEFSNQTIGRTCFTKWFYTQRLWGGKLIYIGIKWHAIVLDFRKDIAADLRGDSND